MKSQISRHSHDPAKRYSGVFQQQGRMITDADWNELQAIVKARLDEALRDVVGGGVPSRRPLSVRFTGATFEIVPGVLYAGGQPARLGNPGDAVFTYATQPDFPSAPGAIAANDLIYVDAWERGVSFLEDPALQDPGLNGADTCTRTQTMLQIKRAPSGQSPELTLESDARNPAVGDALLGVGLRRAQSSTDILDPAADEVAIDQPIGNFVFRVEVHDVVGPANNPTSITLKWSSENAAEAYASGAAPRDYKGSDWTYEFHGPVSEKQLGVHLVAGVTRRVLDDGYPSNEPDKTQLPWVRRWDGWCVLTRPNGTTDWAVTHLVSGKDRGVALGASIGDGVHGHAEVIRSPATGTATSLILRLNLQLVDLQIHLKGKSFVIGDYWLAMARDQFVSGQQLLDSKPPLGPVHRYLQLGKVVSSGGVLTFQADRKMAFPTLPDLVLDGAGSSGAGRIGAETVIGSPSTLVAGTVQSQLAALLDLSNTSNQRYMRRAGSVTVQLEDATSKAVFTSLNPPAAVTFTYSDYDGTTPRSSQVYVQGAKTSQIEVRIDKDNQKGIGTITTDVIWYHVFVTNKTNPLAKVQVNVDVFMIAPPATPEKGGALEGKDTSNENAKAAKEAKDTPDKTAKETKETKETTEKTAKENKESKENTEKSTKESKDSKESKEATEKTTKENKDSKESKEGKESKESKESKENKENKESTKESKEKDRKEKETDKGGQAAIEQIPAPAPGLPSGIFDPHPAIDPGAALLGVLATDSRAFIRPDERPAVGDSLARRDAREAPSS